MEATFTRTVNVRSEPKVTNTNDVGDVFVGDKVYGTITGAWIKFNKIYRVDGGLVSFNNDVYAAIQDPNNVAIKYATLKEVPEPTPQPDPEPQPTRKPLTITFESEEYESVTVTLQPKQ